MKKQQKIQNEIDLFLTIKQYLKLQCTDILKMQKLKHYQHPYHQQLLSSICNYIYSKSKFNKLLSDQQCSHILQNLFKLSKISDNFIINQHGITYISKFNKVNTPQQLLNLIKNNPQGILVDDQLLKFNNTDKIRDLISNLINNRKIIAVRSKGIDKPKDKQDNYQGYYLLPFPKQVQDSFSYIFKTSLTDLKRESYIKQLKQDKMTRIYQTKTAIFKTLFENVCSANINKGQQRSGQSNHCQSYQKIYNNWNPINKISVPNFQTSVQQWFKTRKV